MRDDGSGVFHADDARGETDADGVGEGDVRRKGQSDFEFGAGRDARGQGRRKRRGR